MIERALAAIDAIVSADVAHGFPSAQLAVTRGDEPIASLSWGTGEDTLFDLASNTKMYSVVYAAQRLVGLGELELDTRLVDILGDRFAEEILPVERVGEDAVLPGPSRIWKRELTLRDVLCHRAGFVPDPACLFRDPASPFYVGTGGTEATRRATLDALCRMPLMGPPRGEIRYSDADYMLLGYALEAVTGEGLQEHLSRCFWRPLGLSRIGYTPLRHGFRAEELAPTELHGNTRDGAVSFPGVRTYPLRGEVHDEKAWYCMGGVSGHAGLFSDARDLARLAALMLGENDLFPADVIRQFTAPVDAEHDAWGLGWWRQGMHRRDRWFGTLSGPGTIGHQGWTGTLTVIDPEERLAIAFLTNKLATPLTDPSADPNAFDGSLYTTAALGFVKQLIDEELRGIAPDATLRQLVRQREEAFAASGAPAAARALEAIREAASRFGN